jgi:hypothetical protein
VAALRRIRATRYSKTKKDGRKSEPAAVGRELALSALLLAPAVALLAELIVLMLGLAGLSLLLTWFAGLTGHVLLVRTFDVFIVVSFFIWLR